MKRFPWDWLAAIILGLVVGLAYAWVAAPAPHASTAPDSLRSDFKDEFRSAIASAYAATGDLERARVRLALLGDADTVQALSAQAQRALAAGQSFGHAQDLARLASDLQAGASSIPSSTPTQTLAAAPSSIPVPSASPDLTSAAAALAASPSADATSPAAVPSRTPNPSPSAPFQVVNQEDVCDPALPEGLLQVTVLDDSRQPLPGIEITITWNQGEERFFTGLQPEISDGYADYSMQAGTSYSLQVARLGLPVSGLSAPVCTGAGGRTYVGGLQLTYEAP
ncbi:MAG: hypothetical protein V1755_08770 [Chloroflexota bacterium]